MERPQKHFFGRIGSDPEMESETDGELFMDHRGQDRIHRALIFRSCEKRGKKRVARDSSRRRSTAVFRPVVFVEEPAILDRPAAVAAAAVPVVEDVASLVVPNRDGGRSRSRYNRWANASPSVPPTEPVAEYHQVVTPNPMMPDMHNIGDRTDAQMLRITNIASFQRTIALHVEVARRNAAIEVEALKEQNRLHQESTANQIQYTRNMFQQNMQATAAALEASQATAAAQSEQIASLIQVVVDERSRSGSRWSSRRASNAGSRVPSTKRNRTDEPVTAMLENHAAWQELAA